MNNPVLILYLEDDPRDVELAREKLQQTRMACQLRVARDRAEYEAALAQTRFSRGSPGNWEQALTERTIERWTRADGSEDL